MDSHSSGNGIPYSESGDRDQDEKLLQPFSYIARVPGKNIRTKLAHAFNYWLKIPEDKMIMIQEIVQMLHNASLLIDDIQDNAVLRRGVPVAHSIYGVASTINAANYVIFIALEKVLTLNHPESCICISGAIHECQNFRQINRATKVYTEQLLELHRGQGMEIYWRDSFTCPSEEEYKKMTIMSKMPSICIFNFEYAFHLTFPYLAGVNLMAQKVWQSLFNGCQRVDEASLCPEYLGLYLNPMI
ncbi:hypothetical protein J437_LFUL012591 [Ladona fulva]|uniref:Geranylgeranyl pyrophosphate synthase n=1 Tax=Ladona fulva TaxID=123851 RepID=A0A8K0P494_LADFU|nr:hypothetical protein J437_LFUL012591 [Ladona fulva]